jgi:hypothetical protein
MSERSVMVDEDTIEAAGYAAHGLEAGRRVGWAKAFEFMRRADTAERDVNVLRGDIKILSSFAAVAYGALEVTCKNRITELFRGDNNELKTYLPQPPLNKGRDAMRGLIGRRADELNAVRRDIAEARAERASISDKVFERAKLKAMSLLADSFGFTGRETLLEFLSTSPTHHCADLGCYQLADGSYHFSNAGLLIDPRGWKLPG